MIDGRLRIGRGAVVLAAAVAIVAACVPDPGEPGGSTTTTPTSTTTTTSTSSTTTTTTTTTPGSSPGTVRVSVASDGTQGNGQVPVHDRLAIDASGKITAFASYASNLVPNDTNATADVFVNDQTTGITERISVSSSGVQSDRQSGEYVSMSSDGRFVTF